MGMYDPYTGIYRVGKQLYMTNQKYLSTLQPEEAYTLLDWLMHDYGRNYTDTRCAVIEWLKKEHVD